MTSRLRSRARAWWATGPVPSTVRVMPYGGKLIVATLAVLVVLEPILITVSTVAAGHLVGSVPATVAQGFDSDAGRRLVLALAAVGGAFVLNYASTSTRETLSQVAARRVDRRLKARLLDSTIGPPGVAHLEDPAVLDQIAVTRAESTGITAGMAAGALSQFVVAHLVVVGPIVLLAGYRWWLPVLSVAALLPLRLIMRSHILRSVHTQIDQTGTLRRAQYFVNLSLTPPAAKEARVFGLKHWISDRYRQNYLDAYRTVWRDRSRNRRKFVLPLAATLAADAFIFVLLVRAATSGEIDLTRLTILIGSARAMHGLLSLSQHDVNLQRGAALIPAQFEAERLMAERAEAMVGSIPAGDRPTDAVRFEAVDFRYPGNDRDIYQAIDLEIRAGESLAIVGVNGAGKTTLVKLLARLHDPTGGRITVDGVDLRDLDPASWQRRVAAIFQDFTRYELTAADNVAFGGLELGGDRAALDAAVEAAGAAAIIDGLPHGWDTTLSRRFTGGTDLSGGQWQRIALARALLAVRNGAGILVLDEPTANLDVRAEAELYDRFLELTRGVTTVVISHRFSTVRRADRIVVIDGGRVVEEGDHHSLLARDGTYARMFRLQAARFAEDAEDAAAAATTDEPELTHG